MALSKQLEYDTLVASGAFAPSGGEGPDAPPNPCWHCYVGDHQLCTGVDCYRCPREFHPRLPGIAVTMERASGKIVGR